MKKRAPDLYHSSLHNDLGHLIIRGTEHYITEVSFTDDLPETENPNEVIQECKRQLTEYFAGNRKEFDLPLLPAGTEFQIDIWNLLQKIPYGKTISYLDLARQFGDVKAIRAVGLANGKNPVAIIIPCHRVIGSNGELTGYAGGLWRKKWLLELEQEAKQGSLF